MTTSTCSEIQAARRTIAVLKERVSVMQNGSQSTIQRQLDAARRREDAARQRRELTELRSAELTRYSHTLEDEVARRTLAMSRILDNVKFGFVLVGPDLVVGDEFTKSCAGLFATPTVAGRSLLDLLGLDERQSAIYRVCIEQLFEDILPEEVALAEARTEFRIGERAIRAEASVVRGASGQIEGLLYTISDATELLAAQRENAHNRMLVTILRNRESFRLFIQDTRGLLADAETAAVANDEVTLRRAVHTIKGNSGCYDLLSIAELIHRIEDGPIGVAEVATIRSAFATFLHEHAGILGMELEDSVEKVEVSVDQVRTLRRLARDLGSPELGVWADRLVERPAEQYLGPIRAFTGQLAARLGKEVELSIVGGNTPVDQRMRPILVTLTHLLRNAVAHGIEPVEERGEKDSVGQLRIAVSATDSLYEVEVTDDGRGIDFDRLAASAIERGVVSAAEVEAMSDKARYSLVFYDGVSSAATTTDVAGRGVGMSAVLATVRSAGGTIQVSSSAGKGTTFVVSIPRVSFDSSTRAERAIAA